MNSRSRHPYYQREFYPSRLQYDNGFRTVKVNQMRIEKKVASSSGRGWGGGGKKKLQKLSTLSSMRLLSVVSE
jgi:hypothetical protein